MKEALFALSCVFLLTGCVAFRAEYKVVIDDKTQNRVRFENYKARDLFYEKLDKQSRKAFQSKDEGFIIGLAYGKTVTFYQTSFMNEQIRKADINTDGIITVEEAEKY